MAEITNRDRATWAAESVRFYWSLKSDYPDAEEDETKAKDLACDLMHFLRLECGMDFEAARNVIMNATNMAEIEMNEDSDEG